METKKVQKAEFQNKLGLSFVISMTIALMALMISHDTPARNNIVKMADASYAEVLELQEPAASPQADEDPIFVVVQKLPKFPGGHNALFKFILEHKRYPERARDEGIQGSVLVSFVVEKDGSVSNVKVLSGIGGGCDEEAVRVVESLPRWIPGRQRGQPVRVRFNMPIKFTLN